MQKSRAGFTLVELMVVVVILGVLATIALPRLSGNRDKAKLAAVKSDVRNTRLAEEAYFSDHGVYGSVAQLQADGLYKLSSENTIFIKAGGGDYLIRVTDSTIESAVKTCSVQVGPGIAPNLQGAIICP